LEKITEALTDHLGPQSSWLRLLNPFGKCHFDLERTADPPPGETP
jgi:hypothetical protein